MGGTLSPVQRTFFGIAEFRIRDPGSTLELEGCHYKVLLRSTAVGHWSVNVMGTHLGGIAALVTTTTITKIITKQKQNKTKIIIKTKQAQVCT